MFRLLQEDLFDSGAFEIVSASLHRRGDAGDTGAFVAAINRMEPDPG